MVNPRNPNEFIPEELLEVGQELWQQQYTQQPIAQPQTTPNRQQVSRQQRATSTTQNHETKPMDHNTNRTVETIKFVQQSPGELKSLTKQAKLTQQLQKLQNRSSNSFEEELADGARAAGQTGRIVVENANPFTGPVRAYSYISLIVTTAGLIVGVLYIAGGLGSKVANNVKVQVRYGQEQPATTPSRLTTGRGNPPVVDWVPGGR